MSKSRKVRAMSLFMAILLAITLLPVTAFAQSDADAAGDAVIYNLGTQEVTVDSNSAMEESATHKLFNEDGSYTILLEDNAFFPYEVQFSYGNTISVGIFDTSGSTVVVGGHTFEVATNVTNENTLSQIGVTIGDEYIPAVPEPKTFTLAPGFGIRSLIPLTFVKVSLDLRAYDRFKLNNVPVSAILSGLTPSQSVGGDARVVWSRYNNNNEQIVEQTGSIDLSNVNSTEFTLELIVGSALQLDEANTRYIVNVTLSEKTVDAVDIYTEQGNVRTPAVFVRTSSYNGFNAINTDFYLPKNATAQTYYVGLTLNSAYSDYAVKVLDGYYSNLTAAVTALENDANRDISSKTLNQTLTNVGTGLAIQFDSTQREIWKDLALLFYDGETPLGMYRVVVYIASNSTNVRYGNLYNSTGYSDIGNSSYASMNGVEVITVTMDSGYTANANYLLRLFYEKDGSTSSANWTFVDKAVLGHYDTPESAASQTDIKDDLFPEYWSEGAGYSANYSGDGKNFTIFAEGEVYKITVKAVDAPTQALAPALPRPGSPDTYFQVRGAAELSNVYVLPYEHDSYYDLGFQTVFYTDDVPLAALKPTFWNPATAHTYSGHSGNAGTLQESGVTVQDFSKGAVQYAVSAEDGTSLKNYWVTFVKKDIGGSKLFINGINGDEGLVREVFLTSIHSNRHDIFIANIGDADLTGLTATLTDAKNIKLDPYWTVGGKNNNTLAAFTDTNPVDEYAELANVGKIRLLPDGEGEISGTLTIFADGQTPVVIRLTGNAGNPKLTTSDIPEAVKYVPYGVQLLHNNKYSWNRVTMEISKGTLPKGVILKPNGELYGVPQETGTFEFSIRMTNSDTRFGSSSATYTLVVKENTDENVNAQTDAGYEIQVRIPDIIELIDDGHGLSGLQDHVFQITGVLGEYKNVYIDGVELSSDQYILEDGSTKITVKSQTFAGQTNGTHTIAGEFRVNGDENQELKKAAQNYKVDIKAGGNTGGGTGGNNTGGSTGGNYNTGSASAPAAVPPAVITTSPAPLNTNIIATLKDGEFSAVITAQQLSEAGNANRTITVTSASCDIVLDVEAVKAIGSSADVYVAYKIATAANGEISFPVTFTKNGATITDFDKGIVSIVIPYSLPNGVRWTQVVPYCNNNGKLELVMGGYNAATKCVEMQLRHLSEYVVKINNRQYEGRGGWYDDSLDWAAQRGLIDGFIVDGAINAAQNVTRSDFVTALVKSLGIQPLTSFSVTQFSDVSGENAVYIQTARQLGIISGIGGNQFDPTRTAKREEQFQIVYNLIQTKISTTASQNTNRKISDYKDADTVPEWLKPALSELLKLGIVQGDGTNLNVKDNFTIGQVCVVLRKMAAPKAAV